MLMRGLRYARLLPYLSIDGWLTVNEAIELYELARSVPAREPVVVEIGSWQGKSSVVLGKGLQHKERAVLYCVDPFNGAGDPASEEDYRRRQQQAMTVLRERFTDNLDRNGVRELVEILQGYSHDVVKNFERPIDLLFIDGNHDYQAVLADFRDWTPMVVSGGLICMHDVGNPAIPGPQQVVDEELRECRDWVEQRHVDSLFIARKRGDRGDSGCP
jgi:predicted O-methyltransferase YrrM